MNILLSTDFMAGGNPLSEIRSGNVVVCDNQEFFAVEIDLVSADRPEGDSL